MSVTQAAARELVYQRWKTQWDVLHPTFPWFLENEINKEPTTTWARVTFRQLDSQQHTMGKPTRLYRRDAAVWVQFFGPLNQGMKALDTLVADARTVFEGVTIGQEIDPAGAARVTEIGPDGKWYEVVVVIPMTYYESR